MEEHPRKKQTDGIRKRIKVVARPPVHTIIHAVKKPMVDVDSEPFESEEKSVPMELEEPELISEEHAQEKELKNESEEKEQKKEEKKEPPEKEKIGEEQKDYTEKKKEAVIIEPPALEKTSKEPILSIPPPVQPLAPEKSAHVEQPLRFADIELGQVPLVPKLTPPPPLPTRENLAGVNAAASQAAKTPLPESLTSPSPDSSTHQGVDPGGDWFVFPKEKSPQIPGGKLGSQGVPTPSPRSLLTPQPKAEGKTLSEDIHISNRPPRRFVWWGVFAGIAVTVGVVALLSTVFARTTIRIKPRVESVAIEKIAFILDASATQLNIEQSLIPAERLEFTKSATREVKATGKETVETRAKGTVRIFNAFSTASQSLVATTRFLTPDGKLFRLPAPIVVPGARSEGGKLVPQFVETDLAADVSGEAGNLSGEVTLKIPGFQGTPKYEGFYAIASEGFSGGFKGERSVIADADLTTAQEEATKEIYDALKQEMKAKIPPDFIGPDPLQELRITKVDVPDRNAVQERFVVSAEATGRILVFRKRDLITLFKERIVKDDQTKTFLEDSLNISYTVRTSDMERGYAELQAEGTIKTQQAISDQTRQDIAHLIRGKKEGSARELLKSREEFSSFTIDFFPAWLSTVPGDSAKIQLVIDPVRAPESNTLGGGSTSP